MCLAVCLGKLKGLEVEFLEDLKRGKNLLAFSGGVDSSALYFLLKSYGISFDVAIVDYGIRRQSSLEVSYAKNLCFLDGRKCFVKSATKIQGNFESNARALRYEFFESLIKAQGYTHLILAHQLNDALEWFLMQFCKGTSLEKMQMLPKVQRSIWDSTKQQKRDYWLVRPLWKTNRRQILHYLSANQIFYFEDFSNFDTRFKRNYFRKNFADKLILEFASGIAFSLDLLRESVRESHKSEVVSIESLGKFCVLKMESLNALNVLEEVDFVCKSCGVLLSRAQKLELKELLKAEQFSQVFKHKIAIEKTKEWLFICPYLPRVAIPKKVRELYRTFGIPPKFRIFLFEARNLGLEQKILDIIFNLRSENE